MIAIGEVPIALRAIVDSNKRLTVDSSLPLELSSATTQSATYNHTNEANSALNILQAVSKTINTSSNLDLDLNSTTLTKGYTRTKQFHSIDTIAMKLAVESDEMKIVDCGKPDANRQIWIG